MNDKDIKYMDTELPNRKSKYTKEQIKEMIRIIRELETQDYD